MGLVDRYSSAIHSSNLRASREHVADVDVLTAAGWAANGCGLAGMLYRARTEADRGARPTPELRQALVSFTVSTAARAGIDADTAHVAGEVLGVFLAPWCVSCKGVKFTAIAGTTHLSDAACPSCHGTGSRELHLADAELTLAHLVQDALTKKLDSLALRMARALR